LEKINNRYFFIFKKNFLVKKFFFKDKNFSCLLFKNFSSYQKIFYVNKKFFGGLKITTNYFWRKK